MRSDGSAWLRHAFGLATMSWAFCLAACKNSPSVWIFTLQFDASELWKGFWFAHGFVTKRYKGIRMHHFSLRYMIYSITYISYVQIVWTRCASGFISSIGKKKCIDRIGLCDNDCRHHRLQSAEHVCHLAHWQCLRAAIASACAFHSAAWRGIQIGIDCTHIHIFLYLLYINNKCIS